MKRLPTFVVVLLTVLVILLAAVSAGAEEATAPPAVTLETPGGQDAGEKAGAEAVTLQPLEVVQELPDYKAMYFAVLARNLELEAELAERDKVILELRDLALGYRSDWEAERQVAEARKAETDKAVEIGKMLLEIVRDMKDTISKQHEIIMTLTTPQKMGLQVLGGAVVFPREPTNPGLLLGIGWHF